MNLRYTVSNVRENQRQLTFNEISPSTMNIHDAAFCGDARLLKKIIDENSKSPNEKEDRTDQTPLHKASMNGWFECVKLLVERGSHANAADVAGCTALHYAAANGYVEVARYLIQEAHANIGHKTKKGHTPRYMAKARVQTRMVAYFNELENKMDGNTWLS